MVNYLTQVYFAFRGEIPQLKQSKTIVSFTTNFSTFSQQCCSKKEEIEEILAPRKSIGKSPKKRASLEREPKRQVRKRRSHDSVIMKISLIIHKND
jgi:hypothetical protein